MLAAQNDITVVLSNPSFDIWLLFHFKYSTKQYSSNVELLSELQNRWLNYSKNIGSFEEIFDRKFLAIDSAKQLRQFHNLEYQLEVVE